VGLKRGDRGRGIRLDNAFSRTPRGFEACRPHGQLKRSVLSAEPLVGLKHLGER